LEHSFSIVLCEGICSPTIQTLIFSGLKYLRINGSVNNKVLLDNLPTNLKTLEIINNLDFDMTNLPELIEELIIDIPVSNFYLNNLMGGGMGLMNNIHVEAIKEQNNVIKQLKTDVELLKQKKTRTKKTKLTSDSENTTD
jgi:hypothetical protein